MTRPTFDVTFVRHATLLVDAGETTFLVDPMLGEQGSAPPIENTPNQRPNPLVPLPDVPVEYDAVVVTHRHLDHFDDAAKEALPDDVPLFCNPVEADAFTEDGFTDVRPVEDGVEYEGVTLTRTPARHGHGDLAEQMGPVCGFVFEAEGTLYLAGDTVWYDAVPETLDRFAPDVVVLNAGAARFTEGEEITMAAADVRAVRDATDGAVVAVHLEAINHCLLTREALRAATEDVLVPEDGESMQF